MNKREKSKTLREMVKAVAIVLQLAFFLFLSTGVNLSLIVLGAFLSYVSGDISAVLIATLVGVVNTLYLYFATIMSIKSNDNKR